MLSLLVALVAFVPIMAFMVLVSAAQQRERAGAEEGGKELSHARWLSARCRAHKQEWGLRPLVAALATRFA